MPKLISGRRSPQQKFHFMKKFLKIFGIVLAVLILLLLLTPIIFEKQLKNLVMDSINNNLNAKVTFADIDLNLFRNFPDATLGIDRMVLINNAPFEGDTLAVSEEVVLQMNVNQLFRNSGEPLKIDELKLENTQLYLKIDSLGNANYDIAIASDAPVEGQTSPGISFDVEHYEINNSLVSYNDAGAGISLLVSELNHEGTGDFSANMSKLSTFSTALVSFEMDETNYLDRHSVKLEADFMMDLENMKFTFLENEALINQLPLTFDGFVQVNENNNEINLTFETPTSSFKNFLAVIPAEYSKNIEEVETKGDFIVNGYIRGIVDELHIPKMEINIASENASFKYPDLPKAVEDITIDAKVVNETGLTEDTYVLINTLNFRIDEDAFRATATLRNLMENMLVDMSVAGRINLENIEKAYPLELEQELNGIVTADFSTRFDMNSIEKEQYQNVQSSGTATIEDFSYSSPEIPNEIELATALLKFNAGNVSLENFVATTGQTDLAIEGTLQNLMGYLFADQVLKGNFTARSNTFSVNDFMVKEIPAEEEIEADEPVEAQVAEEAIKIPSFLAATLDFKANRVLYDNLVLENATGILTIEEETARLQNVTANIFGGQISINGIVSTKNPVPTFDMEVGLKSIDIARSFADMELLRNIAPIAQALRGNLNSTIDLQGNLNQDLTPQLNSLTGSALAALLNARVVPEETVLLEQLDQRLNFIDLNNLNLKDLETQLSFSNGNVEVQPFDFEVKGIKGVASGTHNFDLNMNYNVALEIPARLLGDQIGGTLSRLSASQLESMTVALPINLVGTFTNPKIDLNLDQAVKNLAQGIIQSQKETLKEKGKDILGGILTGKRPPQDTTATIPQKTDSVIKPGDRAKEAARDILGGILSGQKKKKDTTQ